MEYYEYLLFFITFTSILSVPLSMFKEYLEVSYCYNKEKNKKQI